MSYRPGALTASSEIGGRVPLASRRGPRDLGAAMRAFVRKHPVACFYALVFTISWGGILLVVRGAPGTSENVQRLMPMALVAMFAGPSIAGLAMNALVSGRAGLRELLSRFTTWRMAARWYAIALLTGPLLVSGVLFALSLHSPAYLPGIVTAKDKAGLLLFGVAWALTGGGLLEETGWTGFAVPTLRLRRGAVATGLIVGLMWGVWHFLIAFWASGSMSGGQSIAVFVTGFIVFYLAALPAYRILMVKVYDRTRSLLNAMLMHASLSASTLILQPTATGMPYLVWNAVLAALLWLVVAIVSLPRELRSGEHVVASGQ